MIMPKVRRSRRQLPQLLDQRPRRCGRTSLRRHAQPVAALASKPVAATNTSSRLACTTSTCAATPDVGEPAAHPRRPRPAPCAIEERVQPGAELGDTVAPTASPSSAPRARRASSASISTTSPRHRPHQLLRRAFARPAARGRGWRGRGSARPRPCSASTPGWSCRAPTSANRLSQKSRRLCGSTALVGSSSSSSSGPCSVAAASASRCRCPPLMRAGALRRQLARAGLSSTSAMRRSTAAPADRRSAP